MSPVRDHRAPAENWPAPYRRRGHAQPPKITAVSLAAPLASWTEQAACHGKWDLFDPLDPGATDAERTEQLAEARRICQSCPVAVACGEFARSARPAVVGIWSGRRRHPSSPTERSTTA